MPLECVFKRMKSKYILTFVITCILTPCLVTLFIYLKILINHSCKFKFLNNKVRVDLSTPIVTNSSSRSNNNHNQSRLIQFKREYEAIKLAKCLFLIFLIFVLCW